MDDAEDDLVESITGRISRMNQLFSGRCSLNLQGLITGRESILDAFLVLYEECRAEYLSKNQYVTSFVNKYKDTVTELRKLRINIKDFEVKDTIGRGHFGEVQVVREKSSGDVYALKVLRKADTLAQQNVAFYEEERDILAKASSPWITHLQYAFQDKQNLYLVMEFHPGGDLLALLSRYDDIFEESMARFYLAEMVLGVHALHTMGYVHRDVKPENILIDRTGHIKLADFGSACKLSDSCASVANMPVGTPDYICPEVLLSMNSDNAYGKFGEECDWWSLGVCAYEMLFGKTPFTDENGSMVVTYANITSFKKCLKFPKEHAISKSAEKLIRELLRDPEDRLKYEDIRVHEFFMEVNFDNIRHHKPPFIPVVMSNDDVSNFDEFEKMRKQPRVDDFQAKTQFSGQDLPFIGFTFTKTIPGSNERSFSTNSEISSPAAKGSLERRLAAKSRELVEMRERYKEMEHEKSQMRAELDQVKRQMSQRDCFLDSVQAERDALERDMAKYISECNSMKRALELEKSERSSIDNRLMALMRDIEDKRSQQLGLRDQDIMDKLGEAEDTIVQLEEERLVFVENIQALEKKLEAERQKNSVQEKRISEHQHQLTQLRAKNLAAIEDAETELETVKRESAQAQDQLRYELDKALASCAEATRTLSQVRQTKVAVEEELHLLKNNERKANVLRSKLSDSEEHRRSLEVAVHRLSLIERREDALRQELTEKSQDVVRLAERVAELEGRLQSQQLEYSKCERIYEQRQQQLNNRISEMQHLIDTLTVERGSLEEQSLLAFEENEERLEQIKEQETTILVLRSTVETLEEQVGHLRDDLQQAAAKGRAVRHARSASLGQLASPNRLPAWVSPRRGSGSRSRRSGCAQTDGATTAATCVSGATQTTEHYSPNVTTRRSNQVQTDSPRSTQRQSNCTQTDLSRQSQGNQTNIPSQTSFSGQTETKTKVRVSVSFGSPRKSGSNKKRVGVLKSMNHSGSRDDRVVDPVGEDDEDWGRTSVFQTSHDTMNEGMCDEGSWAESEYDQRQQQQQQRHEDVIAEEPEEEEWSEEAGDQKDADGDDWEDDKEDKDEDADDDWDDEGQGHGEKDEEDRCDEDGDEDNWDEEAKDEENEQEEEEWEDAAETGENDDGGEEEEEETDDKKDEGARVEKTEQKDEKNMSSSAVNESSSSAYEEPKRPIGKVEISSIFGPRVSGCSFGKRWSNNTSNDESKQSSYKRTSGTQDSQMSSPKDKSDGSDGDRKASDGFVKRLSKSRFTKRNSSSNLRGSLAASEKRVSSSSQKKGSGALDELDRHELERMIHDLQNEKKCLECQIKSMDREFDHLRDSCQQQRLRALDFKYELSQKKTDFDAQLTQLKDKVDSAEIAKSKAEETANNLTELEATARQRAEALQQNFDQLQRESKRETQTLQEERDELDTQVKALKNSLNRLENIEEDLKKSASQCAKLEPKNKQVDEDSKKKVEELESELNLALSEKNHFKMAAERSRDQLAEKSRQIDVLQQRYNNLKVVCTELETQIQDLEMLTSTYEDRQNEWHSHKDTYEKAVDERENEITEATGQLLTEKTARERFEQRTCELKELLRQEKQAHASNVNMLRRRLDTESDRSRVLDKQMTELENQYSSIEVEKKGLVRQISALTEENVHLKEEVSKHITANSELKSSNLKLSKELEEATDQYELLFGQKNDIENRMETEELNNRHDRFKLEQTLNQQTKLIDYLQAQVHQPPKKKKTIFGSRRADETFATSIQFRELQHSLEHEREKNAMLRTHITRMKEELNQVRSSRNRGAMTTTATTQPAVTPVSQSSRSVGQLSVPSTPAEYTSSMGTPKISSSSSRMKRERVNHNIPHRFITGLNSRATKCVVCLGTVHFVKQAAKCQECGMVCHPKCSPSLPAACGLPTEYVKYLSDAQNKTRASVSNLQQPPLMQPHLTGILKVPRMGKQLWEKRWVVCDGQQLHFYADSESKTEILEALPLCPTNGKVTIHSAVTAAELTSTAQSDLPYILRLDSESETTCWPDRRLYLMAQNFSDKQRWVATLEAIVTIAGSGRLHQDAKMLGNTLATLSGEHRSEFNCTVIINKMALVGADEGLFMKDLSRTSQGLVHVKGTGGIFQIVVMESLGIAIMITGRERQVVVADVKVIQQCAQSGTILPVRQVAEATACTTLAVVEVGPDVMLCVALSERLMLMKYDLRIMTFLPHKEHLLSTVCSCMHLDEKGLIVGTDRFYKLDLDTFIMAELLDKSDTSLAFAVFGAAHYESFPIAVLPVSHPGGPKEYLLCYHEFGIFVNSRGRRSRVDDMKWAGLPLAFGYHEPYLYVAHFNSLEIIEILPSDADSAIGAKTMVTIANPRYLGNALTPGAIYVGSMQESKTEILCIRGNLSSLTEDKENRTSATRTHSLTKMGTSALGNKQPSSTAGFQSPPVIQQLERSPSRNPDYITTNSEEDTVSTTSSSELTDVTNRQTYTYHRRCLADSDSDSSG